MTNARPTLTTTQAGRLLDCTEDTVRVYWRKGLIEGYRTIPGPHGRLRLYRDSVEEFDRKRKSQPLPDKN